MTIEALTNDHLTNAAQMTHGDTGRHLVHQPSGVHHAPGVATCRRGLPPIASLTANLDFIS